MPGDRLLTGPQSGDCAVGTLVPRVTLVGINGLGGDASVVSPNRS